jgi:hypothetical protein
MAKIMRLSLSLSVIALLLLAGQLRAEDYVSKDVPPDEIIISTVVICHARVSMVPLEQPEYADTDQGVCDGMADCDICAGGDRPRGGRPRPV